MLQYRVYHTNGSKLQYLWLSPCRIVLQGFFIFEGNMATKTKSEIIKVHITNNDGPGESLWAIDKGMQDGLHIVELNNVPFSDGYSCGDLVVVEEVSVHQIPEVVRIFKRVGKTCCIKYNSEGDEATVLARLRKINEYLRGHGYKTEGFVAGILGVTMPFELKLQEFDKILKGAPEKAVRL